jgi:polysaccharide biosynthesis/export protein
MRRLRVIFIVAAGALCVGPGRAEQPPKELVQYVREARKAGLNEGQVQQNALKAGWSPAVVADAIQSAGEEAAPSPSAKPPKELASAVERKDQETAHPSNAAAVSGPNSATPAASEKPDTATPAAPDTTGKIPGTAAAVDPTGKTPATVNRGVPDDYVIGAGDVLHISVWKEPDASVPSVTVRPDGKITMPMLKEVAVAGLTCTQAEKMITEQLSKFLSAVDVTVIVSAINSKKIYLVGAIKKEGPMAYNYRMTVLQAISEAGGLTDYAKKKRIYILRHENGRDYKLPFDYDAVLRGEHMELNVTLLPGDTLVVPK